MMCGNAGRLVLQFHITGKCNLRCKHCYRTEGDVEPLCYDDVVQVINQYRDLRCEYNSIHRIKRKGHINITGGEPFIRNDIKDILRYIGECKNEFSYGLLSNGSFIDDEIISVLKETNVSFVQLSIDGDRQTHDSLRAPGDYDRVFSIAGYMEKNKIRTYISFTANKDNFKYIPIVAKECRKRGITKLWSDRIVPIGNGSKLENIAITPDAIKDYVKTLRKSQGNFLTKLIYPGTEVTMNRALQFMDGGNMYSCGAANTLITVDEFGNVMPCRRMPIICGNVFESTLRDIYFENEVFLNLRRDTVPEECASCIYKFYCRGGAKCQSYAIHGDYNHADPGCPFK